MATNQENLWKLRELMAKDLQAAKEIISAKGKPLQERTELEKRLACLYCVISEGHLFKEVEEIKRELIELKKR